MIWLWIVLGALATTAVGLFLYWALWVTEGAYLGRRVVALIYDWTPGYYDRIKEITWIRDDECLAEPMLARLEGVSNPLILDVGTGTGRFPLAMLGQKRFRGRVWGVDLSIGMLRRARERLEPFGQRCTLIWEDADVLPFKDETFDAVACLETLEFTPDPLHTLSELMRVLRPGGVLLMTNRIGRARWFPGRTYDDETLIDLLCDYPLSKLEIHSWNTFYDQVWLRKHGEIALEGRGEDRLSDWLCVSDELVELSVDGMPTGIVRLLK
jgi:ubiquinone/menaquinone biosynthesis C-methylase UbiE